MTWAYIYINLYHVLSAFSARMVLWTPLPNPQGYPSNSVYCVLRVSCFNFKFEMTKETPGFLQDTLNWLFMDMSVT